jgi:energy-coupling factor transporter transmembrane protein EcfT
MHQKHPINLDNIYKYSCVQGKCIMLLKALTVYLCAVIVISAILLVFKKNLGRVFWVFEGVMLVPLAVLIIYGGILLSFEISREQKLRGIKFSGEITRQVGMIPQHGVKSMLEADEDAVCVFNSNDIRLAVESRSPEVMEELISDDFPAEDGLWYVLFFKGNTLARFYGFESWHGESSCFK